MHIWLDSINVELIQENAHLIDEVTTNPSILAKSADIPATLSQLLEIQKGLVAVQVISQESTDIVEEAKNLHTYSNRIIVKVPIHNQGFRAIAELKQYRIPIMGTAILSTAQALLAVNLGVDFIALYFSHMPKPRETLLSIMKITKHSAVKVLVASLKTIEDLIFCAEIGVDAVTIKDELFSILMHNHPSLENIMAKFQLDWKNQSNPSNHLLCFLKK